MEYRALPHGGEMISVIGLGMGSIHEGSVDEIVNTVHAAIDAGVNYLDFVPSKAMAFDGYARALRGKRDKVMLQVHLGADYSSGDYGFTTDPERTISQFEERLRSLCTDYADFGFIHCIDKDSDFEKVMNGPVWEWAQKAHREGMIRHLGFSTHNVDIARRFIETGLMDMGMFSLNPMYDYTDVSVYGKGSTDSRASLYREFVKTGVGISVMKAFAGGQLLDAKESPFNEALTEVQCIQYALDKPGVLTVLPGVRNRGDLERLLHYFDASPEERDYSIISTFAAPSDIGRCVYCGHCQPCPEGIPIAAVNKYYDLARLSDDLAMKHYQELDRHADDCVHCGHCDDRCPFGVHQSERMGEIAHYFTEH